MSKSTIVHTVPSLGVSGGGPPRSVSQLCGALCEESKREISIVTALYPDDPLVPLHEGIELMTHAAKGHSFAARLQKTGFCDSMHTLMQKQSISLIHQHGIWLRSSHEVTKFANECSIPLVVAPRGMLEPWAIDHSKWKKKLAWALYQKKDLNKVAGFHATADSEAESIRRLGFKQPIAVIPNGIVLPEFSRQDAKSGEGTKTALFLSRNNPKKGLPLLLDAWKRISPKGWRLIIAGNDDSNHLPVVERKVRELGLADQVEIVGPLFGKAKHDAYLNADLFVLPSYSENFGIVVAEALSYGLPVLTTTGCPWQELQTHDCGWWVEPSLKDLEKSLLQAFALSGYELKSMGQRGFQLVESKYQWPGIAERMNQFYDWIVDGGPQPDFVI